MPYRKIEMVAKARPRSRTPIALKPRLRLIPSKWSPRSNPEVRVKNPASKHKPNTISKAPLKWTRVVAERPEMLVAASGTKLSHIGVFMSCCDPNHRNTSDRAIRTTIGALSLRVMLEFMCLV